MAKTKQKKVATTDYLEKHKYTLVSIKMGVLRTNLDLDQVLIMLDPLSEDEVVDFQAVNQSTGELYAVEKQIKLVNIENQD
jgi:hypothetical protein